MLIDLQMHSTYSDGYLTPTRLAELMAGIGVKAAALTDHNTVSGLDEFSIACKRLKIKPIKGLELYCKHKNHKFNLLWYNFDETDPALHNMLRDSQIRRRQLVRQTLLKLKRRGFKINENQILDKHNHYVPINRVVDEIKSVPKNFAKIRRELNNKDPREDEIIMRYLKNKKIGVLKNSLINFERVTALRKKIGGWLVLCHPAKHRYMSENLWLELKTLGLIGVEILSPHHSFGAVMEIQYLARKLGLITTGGSDFHRPEGNNYQVQKSWDYFKIDTKNLRGIKKIIG